jgi:glycerol uptake facilitator-like aquaporin
MTSGEIDGRALAAEALGAALLVAGVVGSGIMAERLTQDAALTLLCNTLATGALLAALILAFAPRSGAHFNPAVTFAFLLRGRIGARTAIFYGIAQIAGAILGAWLAHAMFGVPIFALGAHARTGWGQWLAEAVATFGLLTVAFGAEGSVAWAVGLYITAAYWFTASTSFANPAVTLARALTPSYSGIRPIDAPTFVAAQLIGATLAAAVGSYLFPTPRPSPAGREGASDERDDRRGWWRDASPGGAADSRSPHNAA